MPFRVLDHTADAAIEATAPTLGSLVEALAEGMFALVADVGECAGAEVSVAVSAGTVEDLVVDTLSALLWRAEVDGLLLCRFAVTATDETLLEVVAIGVPSDGLALTGAPVKAVTYHDLEVRHDADGWYARVTFDV
jgi:SHS2 domain-containing protein